MSYHNNYNGFNNRGGGGGFRNNYNNYNNGNGNHHSHFNNGGPRINEMQVPQSKHTIFIRGLPGDIATEEIQEYIGEKVGKISFDFVKLAQDKSKIFVAVRFEKREEAKEFMETYSDREFMGSRCELSWFRDIRRYCAYQRAKQVRSTSQRRRRRSDSEGSQESSTKRSASPPARRRTTRSRSNNSRSASRSPSRTPSRSSSRSPLPKKERASRVRTRSVSKNSRVSRSRSGSSRRSESSERSRSGSSRRSGNSSCQESRDVSRSQSRNTNRDEKKPRGGKSNSSPVPKRRRESVTSSKGGREEEKPVMVAPKKKSKDDAKLPQIPLPKARASSSQSPAPTPTATPKSTKPTSFIPPPTVDMEIESPPQHVTTNPYHDYQQQQQKQMEFQNYQQNQQHIKREISYSVPMEDEAPPKMIVREVPSVYERSYTPQSSSLPMPQTAPQMPSTAGLPAFVPRQIGKIEILMPASLPAPVVAAPVVAVAPVAMAAVAPPLPVATVAAVAAAAPFHIANGSTSTSGLVGVVGNCIQKSSDMIDIAQFPTTNKLFGHLKAFQSALVSTVRYEPPVKKEDDGEELSSLRLSTMGGSDDDDSEELKSLEREQKLAKLNDDQMMRFHIKKKQFETAFRNDCETYAVVTRALLAKDESLQFGLKMSLLENMEDLYKKMMKRVDDQLDALLMT